MTIEVLPEEILESILSFCLLVPLDVLFRDTYSRAGPYTKDDYDRNPQLLRVSRRWLRVGTPLLYSALQILDDDYAQCIADMAKTHAGVRRAIQSLRLDHGYGRHVVDIARHARGIRDLYIDLCPSGSVAHLEEALTLMQPEVLHLRREFWGTPWELTMTAQVVARISTTWKSLTAVCLSPGLGMCTALVEALQHAPALEVLTIDMDLSWLLPFRGEEPAIMVVLQNPSLRTVQMRTSVADSSRIWELVADLRSNERLLKVLQVLHRSDSRIE